MHGERHGASDESTGVGGSVAELMRAGHASPALSMTVDAPLLQTARQLRARMASADAWGGADALYKRIEWCNTVARVVGSRARPVELGDAVLGPALSASTRKSIARAESGVQGLTLLLASPEFQRR